MDEGYDDTGAGVSNSMTQSDSATVNVYLGSWDVEDLLSDVDDNRERLVDLKQGDVINGQTSLLQSLGDSQSRGGGEVNRIDTGVGVGW
jgi:hypothetical protein